MKHARTGDASEAGAPFNPTSIRRGFNLRSQRIAVRSATRGFRGLIVVGRSLALAAMVAGTTALAEVRLWSVDGVALPVTLPALLASQATTLEFQISSETPAELVRVDTLQVAGSLALPIEKDLEVRVVPGKPRMVSVTVTPPACTRVVQMLAIVRTAAPARTVIGRLEFTVYPKDEDREDKPAPGELVQANEAVVVVCGRSSAIRAFLRSRSIAFEDLGESPPDTLKPGELLIGDIQAADWPAVALAVSKQSGARCIGFVPDETGLPTIETTLDARGGPLRVKVSAAVLDRLEADPRMRDLVDRLIASVVSDE